MDNYDGFGGQSGFDIRMQERDAGFQDGYNQGYSDAKNKVKFTGEHKRLAGWTDIYATGFNSGYIEGYNTASKELEYRKMIKKYNRQYNMRQAIIGILLAAGIIFGVVFYNYLETNDTTVTEVVNSTVFGE